MKCNFIFSILGILLISSVCALGITPARTTLDFAPNLKQTVNFDVLSSEGKDLKLSAMVVNGELSQYVSLPSKELFISAGESSKTFSYDLNLPGALSPGLHTGEILIMEAPENNSAGSTQVLATLAVVTQIYIYVPYPGKYADAKMIIYNANENEDVTFVFPVVSAGEFDLTSVKASVDIFNKMGEKIDSFVTSEISVPSGEKKEIVYKWKANAPIGEYRAVAALVYDEGVVNLEEQFSIGSKELELKEINVGDFSLGQVAKLGMLVENKWSEPISGAYIETQIKDDSGNLVSKFQSPSQDIAALSKQLFNSYWDTAGVRVGTYEAFVSINYADKTSQNNLKFKVDTNKLTVIGLGYVVSEDKSSGGNLVTILVVVIVVLVLINLLWFLLIRKRLKKK